MHKEYGLQNKVETDKVKTARFIINEQEAKQCDQNLRPT